MSKEEFDKACLELINGKNRPTVDDVAELFRKCGNRNVQELFRIQELLSQGWTNKRIDITSEYY